MHGNIIEQLKVWKNRSGRKPLVLAGARQVGKTYILKQFGEQEFANVAYINCDDNELAKNLFFERLRYAAYSVSYWSHYWTEYRSR